VELVPEHTVALPAIVPPTDAGLTVTVRVAVALEQPPVPVTVYVIVAVPAATPLIAPVDALIVAIPVLPELQLPPDPVVVKVVEPATHIPCAPLNVPADGSAVTVNAPEALLVAVELLQLDVTTHL
jgi:hypothetical protein